MTSAVFLAFVVLANLAIIRTAPLLRRRERAPHDHQDSSASLTAPPDFSTMLLDCMNSRQTPKEECYGDSEVNNVLSLVGRADPNPAPAVDFHTILSDDGEEENKKFDLGLISMAASFSNASALKLDQDHETLLKAELRLHRKSLSMEEIGIVEGRSGCDLASVTLHLMERVGLSKNQEDVLSPVQSVTLRKEDLAGEESWVVFEGLAEMYNKWSSEHDTQSLRVFASIPAASSHCDVSPSDLGFNADTLTLVGYVKSDGKREEDMVEILGKAHAIARRQIAVSESGETSEDTGLCSLRNYTANLTALGMELVISPTLLNIKVCRGQCLGTIINKFTKHSMLQLVAHNLDPETVPRPCCAAPPNNLTHAAIKKYVRAGSSAIIVVYMDKMVATGCMCL